MQISHFGQTFQSNFRINNVEENLCWSKVLVEIIKRCECRFIAQLRKQLSRSFCHTLPQLTIPCREIVECGVVSFDKIKIELWNLHIISFLHLTIVIHRAGS